MPKRLGLGFNLWFGYGSKPRFYYYNGQNHSKIQVNIFNITLCLTLFHAK